MSFLGVSIVVTPFAVSIKWALRRHPITKRRRNWAAVRIEQPGCWRAGGRLYMHPELYEQIKLTTKDQS